MRVRVLGLCRFSYLVKGGFQVTHDNLEDRRAMLYDPKRLALRFAWFEHVFLPGWSAQTDPDFKMVLLTGTDFPANALNRLRALIADLPHLVIVQEDPGDHRAICRDVMRRHIDSSADWVVEFRNDDDDGVAVDFVERLRGDAENLRPIARAQKIMALDYARGFILDGNVGQVTAHPQIEPRLSVATALLKRPGHPRAILDFAHNKLHLHMPMLSQQDSFMYVRGKHGINDSAISLKSGSPVDMTHEETESVLRRRFHIDVPAFASALGALRGA